MKSIFCSPKSAQAKDKWFLLGQFIMNVLEYNWFLRAYSDLGQQQEPAVAIAVAVAVAVAVAEVGWMV